MKYSEAKTEVMGLLRSLYPEVFIRPNKELGKRLEADAKILIQFFENRLDMLHQYQEYVGTGYTDPYGNEEYRVECFSGWEHEQDNCECIPCRGIKENEVKTEDNTTPNPKNKEEMECWVMVNKFFNGDVEKTNLWFTLPNPGLGGATPNQLILNGRCNKVLMYIEALIKGY